MPRVTDIYAALPAITGKFELEYEGELRGADNVARDIIRAAVGTVFDGYFATADLRQVTEWFDLGGTLQVDDTPRPRELLARTTEVQGLGELTSHAGVGAKPPAPAARGRRRLHPRRPLRAEEDHPVRRVPVSGRRAAAPDARPGPSVDSTERDMPMPGQEEVLQLTLRRRVTQLPSLRQGSERLAKAEGGAQAARR